MIPLVVFIVDGLGLVAYEYFYLTQGGKVSVPTSCELRETGDAGAGGRGLLESSIEGLKLTGGRASIRHGRSTY